MLYTAGVAILDARRAQARHTAYTALLQRKGYDNHPIVVKPFARLGHWYQREAPNEFRAFAAQWGRRENAR